MWYKIGRLVSGDVTILSDIRHWILSTGKKLAVKQTKPSEVSDEEIKIKMPVAIGHFRDATSLCFKTRQSAKPF